MRVKVNVGVVEATEADADVEVIEVGVVGQEGLTVNIDVIPQVEVEVSDDIHPDVVITVTKGARSLVEVVVEVVSSVPSGLPASSSSGSRQIPTGSRLIRFTGRGTGGPFCVSRLASGTCTSSPSESSA